MPVGFRYACHLIVTVVLLIVFVLTRTHVPCCAPVTTDFLPRLPFHHTVVAVPFSFTAAWIPRTAVAPAPVGWIVPTPPNSRSARCDSGLLIR